MARPARIEVHKFGGTSVGDAARIRAAAGLVLEASRSSRVVVVASALGGVTDTFERVVAAVHDGAGDETRRLLDEVRRRHLDVLGTFDAGGHGARDELAALCDELDALVRAALHLGELTRRSRDRFIATGEKLSVRLLAQALEERGLAATAVDADGFLETDGRFGAASPLPGPADAAAAAFLRPHLQRGAVPVVTGFCGRAPDGATTTLGRGGSDLSATWLAAALRADEVVIWTDVNGVLSADPRVVPEARTIRHLNYREAAELSYYGAKVLHQRSMIPVVGPRIPVRIKNSFDPGGGETLVDGKHTPGSHPVKAISAVRAQALLTIEGKGMAGVPGVAARVFRALADEGISVTMISQSSSESSICLAVPDADAAEAETALKREFRLDLSRGDVEEIGSLGGTALVAAVGLGMAHVPGIAARVFGALSRRRVNVRAIAQGSSELNISLAVDQAEVEKAVAAIHHEFGLHRLDTGEEEHSRLDLMLLGFGGIGRRLAELLREPGARAFARFGLTPRIVAVADSSGFVLRPQGIPAAELEQLARDKAAGKRLADLDGGTSASGPVELVRRALEYRLARPVLVDVSDADDSAAGFAEAFRLGCDVVTANKKPLAGDLDDYRSLIARARELGRLVKAEATVGAGLPVVDTLEMLLATGDRLVRCEGCLSGTLAFLMTRLEEGERFSRAVAEAARLGYTEPDPVTDLSGLDVARKATILGRMAGFAPGANPVAPEGLVDAALAGLPAAELLRRLEQEVDEPMARRVREAASAGRVLRYVASVEPGAIRVGPRAVAPDSPLGSLRGTDNMIIFESERYASRPLVVSGPGAGVDVTAMGVLGDILRVAAERR